MQREIIFRGQRVDNKEWVYGDLKQSYPKDFLPTITHWVENEEYYMTSEVILETVGQFTGLLDKNGNKIFIDDLYKDEEGDLWKVIQMKCGRYALELLENGYVDEFIQWDKAKIIGK